MDPIFWSFVANNSSKRSAAGACEGMGNTVSVHWHFDDICEHGNVSLQGFDFLQIHVLEQIEGISRPHQLQDRGELIQAK